MSLCLFTLLLFTVVVVMETFMYRGTMDKIFFLIKNYILMYEKEIGGPRAYTQALGACLIEVRCQDENIIV